MNDLRLRLIERLCSLPDAQLPFVAACLAGLDEGCSPLAASPARPDWPHAPVHRLSEHGTFIVTAGTLEKAHLFRGNHNLALLHDSLLQQTNRHAVVLEAWAVFSNHYHFVAHANGAENQLANMISDLHLATATEINRRDGCPGRPVWFNFWDTRLTFEKSYLARLNYVHQNAVKHGLVRQARDYPWCSAAWFERTATRAQVATIYGFRTDRVKVMDDFESVV